MVMDGVQAVPQNPTAAKASKELMTIGSMFTQMSHLQTLTMMDKGAVTDIKLITETGIYGGTDVLNSPVQGGIMVMANKDGHGNFGYFLMGADRAFHTGGRPAGSDNIAWKAVVHETTSEGVIEIDPAYSGSYPAAIIETWSGSATHDLTDGKDHIVTFKLQDGTDWATATDSRAWYLIQSSGELGNFKGASGEISRDVFKGWADNGMKVTINYDATPKKFNVVKVEGQALVHHSMQLLADGSISMEKDYVPTEDGDIATKKFVEDAISIPLQPTADGTYNLVVASGVATWEVVTP